MKFFNKQLIQLCITASLLHNSKMLCAMDSITSFIQLQVQLEQIKSPAVVPQKPEPKASIEPNPEPEPAPAPQVAAWGQEALPKPMIESVDAHVKMWQKKYPYSQYAPLSSALKTYVLPTPAKDFTSFEADLWRRASGNATEKMHQKNMVLWEKISNKFTNLMYNEQTSQAIQNFMKESRRLWENIRNAGLGTGVVHAPEIPKPEAQKQTSAPAISALPEPKTLSEKLQKAIEELGSKRHDKHSVESYLLNKGIPKSTAGLKQPQWISKILANLVPNWHTANSSEMKLVRELKGIIAQAYITLTKQSL